MNEFKYTPGPWYYSKCKELGQTHFYIAQADGVKYTPNYSDVAFCTCPGEYIDIQEANARLIAVAPELLEVLVKLCAIQEFGDVASWATDWVEARAAIAKATGK